MTRRRYHGKELPPHSSCYCEDCIEIQAACPHVRTRGRSQFCHDSFSTFYWDECTYCGRAMDGGLTLPTQMVN